MLYLYSEQKTRRKTQRERERRDEATRQHKNTSENCWRRKKASLCLCCAALFEAGEQRGRVGIKNNIISDLLCVVLSYIFHFGQQASEGYKVEGIFGLLRDCSFGVLTF